MPLSDENIENRLKDLPTEIKQLGYLAADAKLVWLNAKATLKLNQSKSISIAKTKDPSLTQTDLEAIADSDTYIEALQVNLTEANYKKALADRDELRDGLYSLGNISANRRASGFSQKHNY